MFTNLSTFSRRVSIFIIRNKRDKPGHVKTNNVEVKHKCFYKKKKRNLTTRLLLSFYRFVGNFHE